MIVQETQVIDMQVIHRRPRGHQRPQGRSSGKIFLWVGEMESRFDAHTNLLENWCYMFLVYVYSYTRVFIMPRIYIHFLVQQHDQN